MLGSSNKVEQIGDNKTEAKRENTYALDVSEKQVHQRLEDILSVTECTVFLNLQLPIKTNAV